MKINTDSQIFKRTNSISSEIEKDNSISERLLLFEGFRRIYEVNVKINHIVHEEIYSLGTINRLIPEDVLENKSEIIYKNDENFENNKTIIGMFGKLMVHMYLTWEMFNENEFVRELYPINPYHFFVRIFERGIGINTEHGRTLRMTIFTSFSLFKLLSKENYQETPYLVSTDDEYLDKINAYYAEHNELPHWLEEDNKRGFVL
ncbi:MULTISPECIES: hypothetical protein [unclassified Arcicella]|uniref:hypothetical protein n=1 Tax=unclassified Arcicella TaxID=2644986 RepID=UPI00285AA703|nr:MULTISPECIES: hypothetical protein [unclassified Arcicella]MDR6564997.1 hypothetical protein [Arcicella sp. BE51]MDR6814824.1 hypothetical protein [Arcicella sp. BE140]MDR6826270.1 hypothetical protein [Arcicella sp. BE139]